ncbi:MAG: hypothetical protein NC452_10310 [Eubacterium sp.]|nr:hypothetical protein [Eubacterium sp.]
MKIKFLIGAIGVIAAGIYVVKKFFVKGTTDIKNDVDIKKTFEENAKNVSVSESEENEANELDSQLSASNSFENKMNQTRAETVQNISERHKEAADIIRESVTNILNDSLEDDKILDDIYKDLNNM